MRKAGFTNLTDAEPEIYQEFPSGLEEFSYCASFEDEVTREREGFEARVYLWLYGGKGRRDFTNHVFDRLRGFREQIDASLDDELDWQRMGNWWYSYVGIKMDGSIDS